MGKKAISFVLAVALCVTTMGHLSYAQDNRLQNETVEKANETEWKLQICYTNMYGRKMTGKNGE